MKSRGCWAAPSFRQVSPRRQGTPNARASLTPVEIRYLADCLEHAPTLAQWHFERWKHFVEGDSPERRLRLLLTRRPSRDPNRPGCRRGSAVARLRDAGRIRHGDKTRSHAVDGRCLRRAEFRRRGIASTLVHRAVREAADLGVAKLYLFTTGPEREALYAGLGWSVFDRPIYLGVERVLMSIVPAR